MYPLRIHINQNKHNTYKKKPQKTKKKSPKTQTLNENKKMSLTNFFTCLIRNGDIRVLR
jgi:hypothetical protein